MQKTPIITPQPNHKNGHKSELAVLTEQAIDMNISWSGELKIKELGGFEHIIKSSPSDHTNAELIAVNKTYSVIHFIDVEKDKIHWSTDGK